LLPNLHLNDGIGAVMIPNGVVAGKKVSHEFLGNIFVLFSTSYFTAAGASAKLAC
jgi:hypothetical protein